MREKIINGEKIVFDTDVVLFTPKATTGRGNKSRERLIIEAMRIGDSYLFTGTDTRKVRNAAMHVGKTSKYGYSSRAESKGIRVFCVRKANNTLNLTKAMKA